MSSQRAIVRNPAGGLPVGTTGWAAESEGYSTPGSLSYQQYVFTPDAVNAASVFIEKIDLLIVSDDFNPRAQLPAVVQQLAEARDTATTLDSRYNGLKKKLDEQLKPFADDRKLANARADALYAEAQLFGLAAYLATNDTTPDVDVTIKQFDVVQFDAAAALVWAVDNKRYDLLTLDVKIFEAAAKAAKLPIGVAKVVPQPKATVSTDLSHRIPVTEE